MELKYRREESQKALEVVKTVGKGGTEKKEGLAEIMLKKEAGRGILK